MQTVSIQTIGIVRSCFVEKFGTPRQSGLTPSAVAEIELLEPFNRQEMVKGLELFSHIWVQFLFHETFSEGWKATVRPPRLGGRRRMGIFATRSPHRPNHLGLSALRLLGVRRGDGEVRLEVGGVDLLDGTPVVDIKPYIPYGDCLDDASAGWLTNDFIKINVAFHPEPAEFCRFYQRTTGRKLAQLIEEILAQDPRPASQRDKKHDFGMMLWDVNVRWKIDKERCVVTACEMAGDIG